MTLFDRLHSTSCPIKGSSAMPMPASRRMFFLIPALMALIFNPGLAHSEDVSLDLNSTGGQTRIADGTITVESSGYDSWDRWDSFRFAAQRTLDGDGQAIACLRDRTVTDPWCKAGIMLRDGCDSDSNNVFVMVTGAGKLAVQWRNAASPQCNHFVAADDVTFPIWLRLKRENAHEITAWRSGDGISWSKIEDQAGRTLMIDGASSSLTAGLAVTSHHTDVAASATFSSWSVVPNPWETTDIGGVSAPGFASWSEKDGFTIAGTGFDVWDTSDSFRMVWQDASTDGTLTARVTMQDLKDGVEWRKAGIMMREGVDPQARYAMVTVGDGNKATFQWRDAVGGSSAWDGERSVKLPVWLQLVRRQGIVTGRYSIDGKKWSSFGHPWSVKTTDACQIGMAVTSHSNSERASATFDQVKWEPIKR